MNAVLRDLLAAHHGVLSSAMAMRVGASSEDLARLVASGDLVRIRQGGYVDGEPWRAAPPSERLLVRARLALCDRPGAALARHAAFAAHDLPLHGVDLDRVDLVQPAKRSYRRSGVVTTPAEDGLAYVASPSGLPTVPLPHAIAAVSIASSLTSGLVAADAALHRELVTMADLRDLIPPPGKPGARRLADLHSLVDPLCESPGETRTRLLLRGLGLAFRSQVGIRVRGRQIARVDFLVESRVVLEFDGAMKYGGERGQAALVAEKAREDELRAAGLEVVRLTWRDLEDPARVARLIRDALARSARR